MGRPKKNPEEVLKCKRTVRLNETNLERAMDLSKQKGISFNSYIVELIENDYREYARKKMEDAYMFADMDED